MKPSRNILATFGINGSLRKRTVQSLSPYTEYYLFNSAANLKAYSNNTLDFAYYGYNASNTRSYKLSMLNQNQWVNGQPQPLNLQLQNAMFYPNAYLNFNQNGDYTKHYYNGSERIASRLGNTATSVTTTANARLSSRSNQLSSRFQEDMQELLAEATSISSPVVMTVNSLNTSGNPTDIFYYHTNHLGSTAFVTDQNQNVTQGFLYAPFGEITTEYNSTFGSDIIPKYSFNAKELDEETGMYYYESRYYKPPVFTSRDVMMDQKPWLTPYHYCSNNPIGRVDINGKEDYEIDLANKKISCTGEKGSPDRFIIKKDNGENIVSKEYENGTIKLRNHENNLQSCRIKGDDKAQEIFEFLASHTDIEWGFLQEGKENGKNYMFTSYQKDKIRGFSLSMLGINNYVRTFTHNHPNGNPEPSDMDLDTFEKIFMYNSSYGIYPSFYIYTGKKNYHKVFRRFIQESINEAEEELYNSLFNK